MYIQNSSNTKLDQILTVTDNTSYKNVVDYIPKYEFNYIVDYQSPVYLFKFGLYLKFKRSKATLEKAWIKKPLQLNEQLKRIL